MVTVVCSFFDMCKKETQVDCSDREEHWYTSYNLKVFRRGCPMDNFDYTYEEE